ECVEAPENGGGGSNGEGSHRPADRSVYGAVPAAHVAAQSFRILIVAQHGCSKLCGQRYVWVEIFKWWTRRSIIFWFHYVELFWNGISRIPFRQRHELTAAVAKQVCLHVFNVCAVSGEKMFPGMIDCGMRGNYVGKIR